MGFVACAQPPALAVPRPLPLAALIAAAALLLVQCATAPAPLVGAPSQLCARQPAAGRCMAHATSHSHQMVRGCGGLVGEAAMHRIGSGCMPGGSVPAKCMRHRCILKATSLRDTHSVCEARRALNDVSTLVAGFLLYRLLHRQSPGPFCRQLRLRQWLSCWYSVQQHLPVWRGTDQGCVHDNGQLDYAGHMQSATATSTTR